MLEVGADLGDASVVVREFSCAEGIDLTGDQVHRLLSVLGRRLVAGAGSLLDRFRLSPTSKISLGEAYNSAGTPLGLLSAVASSCAGCAGDGWRRPTGAIVMTK
jgi:hypothetical protein